MLDMSFSEIAVIGAVALVVLGPERLPKVARTAGQLFGRLQRYVATVKADINREMDTSELAKIKQEVQDAAKSFEQSVQQHASSVETETAAISQFIDPQTNPMAVEVTPLSTQNAMLLQPQDWLGEDKDKGKAANATTEVEAPAPRLTLDPASNSAKPDQPMQASLDFGIEPVRGSKST